MSKDAFYFSHDSNAHKDPKVLKLRSKHGWEGYGIYWAIIETLREQDGYKWLASDKHLLTFSFSDGNEKVNQVLDDCLDIGLLTYDEHDYIHSESLTKRMKLKDEIAEKRREAGRKGGSKRKLSNSEANAKQNPSNKSKEKESKEKENIYNEQFDIFWNEYPKKADKKRAYSKFKAAVKRHSFDDVLEGTKGYVQQIERDKTETQFIKHASTFLNNDSFLDFVGSEESAPQMTEEEKEKEAEKEYLDHLWTVYDLGEDYWENIEHDLTKYETAKKELVELGQL